ncbi:hypothetical protein [Kineococcus arenarius]|uniref:hypothetical protein n=1 Tax=Kineococcus sp. SYSU DK007 TaxID=3383128 RepID=UPI003D7D47A4
MRRLSTASTSTTASAAIGAAALVGGAWAWALAATATSAVQAAEARALGPGHTAAMPGEDELVLLAHDVRLAAMAALWCALPLLLTHPPVLPRRPGAGPGGRRTRPPFAAWVGAGVAIVLANALLGPVVDAGPPALAAVLLLAAVAAGTAAGAAAGTGLRSGAAPSTGARWWWLTGSGALAAGTAWTALAQDLDGERYAPFLPQQVAGANALAVLVLLATSAAAALAAARAAPPRTDPVPRRAALPHPALAVVPTALAAVLLLDPAGVLPNAWSDPWRMGPALVAALAPFPLVAGPGLRAPSRRRVGTTALVLVAVAALSTVALPVLAAVVVVGGMLGLLITAPAGAYVNYDGLPMTGAGGLVALGALVVLVVLTGERGERGTPAAQRSPV